VPDEQVGVDLSKAHLRGNLDYLIEDLHVLLCRLYLLLQDSALLPKLVLALGKDDVLEVNSITNIFQLLSNCFYVADGVVEVESVEFKDSPGAGD
jgi:hypothetical protein